MNNQFIQDDLQQEYKVSEDPMKLYLLARLKEIKAGVKRIDRSGICHNIMAFIPEEISQSAVDRDMERLFGLYPNCHRLISGHKSIAFPVDGVTGFHTDGYAETMWTNIKRLKLLDFMIEQLIREMGIKNG